MTRAGFFAAAVGLVAGAFLPKRTEVELPVVVEAEAEIFEKHFRESVAALIRDQAQDGEPLLFTQKLYQELVDSKRGRICNGVMAFYDSKGRSVGSVPARVESLPDNNFALA